METMTVEHRAVLDVEHARVIVTDTEMNKTFIFTGPDRLMDALDKSVQINSQED